MALAGVITIGSIGEEPSEEIRTFLPIARYLAKQLKLEGIDQVNIVVAKGIRQMAGFVREGKVDLYIDSPFPSMAVSCLSESKLLLRRWKKGICEYHSVIFVRKDSGIEKPEDLKGTIIAFEEPFSSSSYFLPKMSLMQRGLKLVRKKNSSDVVGSEEIGYVFSNDDENTMVWVLRKKVPAGAMNHQSYLSDAKGNLDKLKILCRTFSIPRHIVTYGRGLSPDLVRRIKEILITMDQAEEGKKVLFDFEKTTKFDELPVQVISRLNGFKKYIDIELGVQ